MQKVILKVKKYLLVLKISGLTKIRLSIGMVNYINKHRRLKITPTQSKFLILNIH